MGAFIFRRLIQAVVVMVSVAFVAFLLFQYVGDPVVFLLGQDATPQQIQQLRADLGLDQPFFMHSPDGEPWDLAAPRLGGFLAEHADGDLQVIAVTHAGAGKVMRGVHLGLGLADVRHLEVPQDAVFALTPGAIGRFDCA